MHTEICPDCDGSGSIEVEAGGPSGHSTMRLHPVGFGYQQFAYSQVWEPRRSRRTRTEECETCHGEGWLSDSEG
jgi:DnaJ-class molecular chaperone